MNFSYRVRQDFNQMIQLIIFWKGFKFKVFFYQPQKGLSTIDCNSAILTVDFQGTVSF